MGLYPRSHRAHRATLTPLGIAAKEAGWVGLETKPDRPGGGRSKNQDVEESSSPANEVIVRPSRDNNTRPIKVMGTKAMAWVTMA